MFLLSVGRAGSEQVRRIIPSPFSCTVTVSASETDCMTMNSEW